MSVFPFFFFFSPRDFRGSALSGPVLRDTARLSQRYPPIARYGVFGVSTWPNWVRYPLPPFLSVSPLRTSEVEVRYPPPLKRGISAATCAIPYENKANGCDTPLFDTISKGYCAIWGGISHWAAKANFSIETNPWLFWVVFLLFFFQKKQGTESGVSKGGFCEGGKSQ